MCPSGKGMPGNGSCASTTLKYSWHVDDTTYEEGTEKQNSSYPTFNKQWAAERTRNGTTATLYWLSIQTSSIMPATGIHTPRYVSSSTFSAIKQSKEAVCALKCISPFFVLWNLTLLQQTLNEDLHSPQPPWLSPVPSLSWEYWFLIIWGCPCYLATNLLQMNIWPSFSQSKWQLLHLHTIRSLSVCMCVCLHVHKNIHILLKL